MQGTPVRSTGRTNIGIAARHTPLPFVRDRCDDALFPRLHVRLPVARRERHAFSAADPIPATGNQAGHGRLPPHGGTASLAPPASGAACAAGEINIQGGRRASVRSDDHCNWHSARKRDPRRLDTTSETGANWCRSTPGCHHAAEAARRTGDSIPLVARRVGDDAAHYDTAGDAQRVFAKVLLLKALTTTWTCRGGRF